MLLRNNIHPVRAVIRTNKGLRHKLNDKEVNARKSKVMVCEKIIIMHSILKKEVE